MTLTTKLILIAALILSIIIPFGYYLIGERNRKKYKRAIGTNVFFFFGAFVITSIMMFAGPQVHAADAAAASSSLSTGLGYLAAALVTGLSCIGGGIAVAVIVLEPDGDGNVLLTGDGRGRHANGLRAGQVDLAIGHRGVAG